MRSAAVVCCLLSVIAVAQIRPPVALLPDLPSAQVAIPWQELKALIEERRPAMERPLEAPPVEWTIGEASYVAEVFDNGAAQVKASFDIYVWKPEGWTQIPLIAASVAPTQMLVDNQPAPLTPVAQDMRGLVFNRPGPHRVEATFFVPLTAVEGVVTMEFPAAPAAITTVRLTVPTPDAVISAPDAATRIVERSDQSVRADLAFRSAATIAVSWKLPAKLAKATAAELPRVTCTTSTLAAVAERVLSCDTLLVFNILSGATDAFVFTLPKAVNVLEIEGQGAAWSRTENGDLQRIEVKVNYALEDQYTLAARYELPIESELGTVALPPLLVQDIIRQNGWVGVVARDNVEISPSPDNAGFTRVDLSELPSALLGLSSNPILLAYRYNDPGGQLLLDVRKLADVPVRPATIDVAGYTMLITQEGTRMTHARYEVRNNVRQYLRVQLPEDAKVSSASVGGRLVKPARDANGGSVLIPLLQSAVAGTQLGAFPVELVYTQRGSTLPAWHGSLGLTVPAADLPIERASLEVWLPTTHTLFDANGDMNADRPELFGATPGESVEQARRTPKGARQATLHRLREGIERFLITDINNPAGSSSSGGGPRYEGQPIQEPENGAAVAGILPVAVNLPLEGTPYAFSRILVEENHPLKVSLKVYDASTGRRIAAVGVAIALIAAFAAVRALMTRRRHALVAMTLVLSALAGFLMYAYPYGLVDSEAMGIAVAIGAVAAWFPSLRHNLSRRLIACERNSGQTVIP